MFAMNVIGVANRRAPARVSRIPSGIAMISVTISV